MIKMLLIGNLGKDAEVKNINGKNVINFSVCHTKKFKGQDGQQQSRPTWVECAKWGETTGVAPYLKKGTLVYVEGEFELVTYPKNDGTTGSALRLTVANLQLLGNQQPQGVAASPGHTPSHNYANDPYYQQPGQSNSAGITESSDDLPF